MDQKGNSSSSWKEKIKRRGKYLLLSQLTAVLLWLAWPPLPSTFLIFIAFIPLLYLQDEMSARGSRSTWVYVLLCFLSWNLLTTWWVSLASMGGAIAAYISNSLLMTLPFMLFHRTRKRMGRTAGYIALCTYWLGFEYFHLNWEGTWPWLHLGNTWAGNPDWVQWYEYTGALGGSLWILVVNILGYELSRKLAQHRKVILPRIAIYCGVIGLPIVISYGIRPEDKPLSSGANIIAVQPNLDPYTDKFGTEGESVSAIDQVRRHIKLSEDSMDDKTVLILWPETAVVEFIHEKEMLHSPSMAEIQAFLHRHPKVKLLTGINSYTTYQRKATLTARKRNELTWYDMFNTAIIADTSPDYTFYHKSRLVPGVERMPYPGVLGFLESLSIDMGGSSGSLAVQDSATVFRVDKDIVAAPIICYESIFGEYVGSFVNQGANIITIITNDGWWGKTNGMRQHFAYARLRAIESRCFLGRSANTGISGFIAPSGKILQSTEYGVQTVIKSHFLLNNKRTFYNMYGDYLGRIAIWLSLLFIVSLVALKFRNKKVIAEEKKL